MKKFLNRSEKGFTLIELLVVIAIIAILSTIVLASLGTARDRAQVAKIKGQLSQMPAAAELYYDTQVPVSYGATTIPVSNPCTGGMFSDTNSGMARLTAAAALPSGAAMTCTSTSSAWAATITFKNAAYCVDSTTNTVNSKPAPTTGSASYVIGNQTCA